MVENQEVAQRINEVLVTLLEAVFELKGYLQRGEKGEFQGLGNNSLEGLLVIQKTARRETEDVYRELETYCENCYASMEYLLFFKENEIGILLKKLEFEYYPLLRITHARFYYMALVEGNTENEEYFWKMEAVELLKNPYIENGIYSYDISISVLAYNNLEYTKLCLDALLKFMPRTLRCELILINHGSSDKTKEYFESLFPEKQIDIKINSADGIAYVLSALIAEGEYILTISNDVILSKNAVEIMFSAMKRDKKIAYAVPITPNIVNLQSEIPKELKKYKEVDSFCKAAGQYNKENKYLEEMRVRLLNPLFMCRTEYWINSDKTKAFAKSLLRRSSLWFWDDELSLLFRRVGYKNVLMRNIVCYHFGSVTVETYQYQFDSLKERKYFYKRYGVDPYEKGIWWTPSLFQILTCKKTDAKRILSINAGFGSDPLKIKEELKKQTGNVEVQLISYTMEKRFLADLAGISNQAEYVSGWKELFACLEGKFDYIMAVGGVESIEMSFKEVYQHLYFYLEKEGIFILQTDQKEEADWFEENYSDVRRTEGEIVACCEARGIKQYFAVCKNNS